MKIAQILLPDAPLYERKTRGIDARLLSREHRVLTWVVGTSSEIPAGATEVDAADLEGQVRRSGVSILQVYGPPELPAAPFTRLGIPYVANGIPQRGLLAWRAPRAPARHVLPFGPNAVAEPVDDPFFWASPTPHRKVKYRIGSMGREAGVVPMVQATTARLARFRADFDWQVWPEPPSPDQIANLDLWVDPTVFDNDLDGFVAEALVCGIPVVAARTPVNRERLAEGQAGFLVPPGDANEMTHAIVSALFKSELRDPRLKRAQEMRERFRSRHRVARLLEVYGDLTR